MFLTILRTSASSVLKMFFNIIVSGVYICYVYSHTPTGNIKNLNYYLLINQYLGLQEISILINQKDLLTKL